MLSKISAPSLFKNVGSQLRKNAVRTISGLKSPADIVIDDPRELPSLIDCRQGERFVDFFFQLNFSIFYKCSGEETSVE